jgi:hypothetical protein
VVAQMSWTCSHGCTYSEEEMEMGMKMSTMHWLMAQDEARHHLEADQAREIELRRAHVAGEAECPWPWYADPPIEIQEPEVFDVPTP